MEKVWAKVSGNYDITTGGWMSEAVDFLTGAPSASWTNLDPSTINGVAANAWAILTAANASSYIMTAGTPGYGCDADDNDLIHLPCDHAYTLLGVYNITGTNGTVTNRLVQLRNPWGQDAGYNGTWNDADTKSWTAAHKAQVPYVNNTNDGIFWVEDVAFVKYFDSFIVSYAHSSWNNTYTEVVNDTLAGPVRRFNFTVSRAQEVYVGAEFYDSRMYPDDCKLNATEGILYLYKGSTYISGTYVADFDNFNYLHFPTLAVGNYSIKF